MKAILCKSAAATALCAFGLVVAAEDFSGYAKREMPESVNMDAFENADFEDVSKFGKVNDNIEFGRFGFNGNGGMRQRPHDKRLVWRLPFKGRLEKGRRYVFVATVNVQQVTGSGIQDEEYAADRKAYGTVRGHFFE